MTDKPQDWTLSDTPVPEASASLSDLHQRAHAEANARRARRRRTTVVALLSFVALFLGSIIWTRITATSAFPVLPPGVYVGSIVGLSPNSPDASSAWLIERPAEGDQALVWFSGHEPAVQTVSLAAIEGGFAPLQISLGSASGTVQGEEVSTGAFEGTIRMSEPRLTARWSLAAAGSPAQIPGDELKKILLLDAETSAVDDRIHSLENLIPAQKREIEELSKLITDDRELKRQAQDRFSSATESLAAEKARLDTLRKEVTKLEEQLRLAQRLNGRGRLVTLARETLDREGRWAQSMMSGGGAGSQDLESAVQRGNEVVLLKDEIESEERRIAELAAQLEGE